MNDNDLANLLASFTTTNPHTRQGFDAVFTLEHALEGQPEFEHPRGVVNGGGWHGWLPQFVAQRMLSMVRAGHDPKEAVAWFRRAPSIERGRGGAVKALYGVICDERISISDDIVLMPLTDLPRSEMLDWLFEMHEKANEHFAVHGHKAPPSACLYREGLVEPIFVDTARPTSESVQQTWLRDLDDAARLLALTPDLIPMEAGRWLQFDDPDVSRLCQFGLTRQNPELQPLIERSPVRVAQADVEGVLASYRRLHEGHQRRLSLALERVIRARCQFVSGNRAIDLAIALEVLFMGADRDEHSYKISLRAARLVRRDAESRRVVFDWIRRLYDMRSTMVHSGRTRNEFNVDGKKVAAHQVVEAADRTCTESIRAVLRIGEIPEDWRAIELE